MGGLRSPEAIAKFKKTMAAKRAAGWTPKGKPVKKSKGNAASIPLDAVPERERTRVKKKAVKAISAAMREGRDKDDPKVLLALALVNLIAGLVK